MWAGCVYALFPENEYARQLQQATTDLYNPQLGYYEGFSEKTGKPETARSGNTNSLILQSLLYMTANQQPLIRPETAMDSPWWRAVAAGDPGRGLPRSAAQTARLIVDSSGAYWTSSSNNTTPVAFSSADPPNLLTKAPAYQGGLRGNPPSHEGREVNPPSEGGLEESANAASASRNAIPSPALTVELTASRATASSPTTPQQSAPNAVDS